MTKLRKVNQVIKDIKVTLKNIKVELIKLQVLKKELIISHRYEGALKVPENIYISDILFKITT